MERAVQLSPQDALIQMLYAMHLLLTVQPGTLEAMEKAYRLDPLSPGPVFFYALTLGEFGRVLDAERVMASSLVTAAEQTDLDAATLYLQTQNFELAEQHLERAKAVWGADDPRVLANEYQLARARGDDALASSIEQELLRRMENESVLYDGFGSADSLKRRYQLAYQQRQFHFVGSVLRNKPPQFTDEEWQDLREKMNIAELGDTALPTLRTRTEAEANAVLARRVDLDPAVIDDYVGVYDAAGFVVEFSRRGAELWIEVPQLRYQGRTVAIAENQFELLDTKGYQFRFMEPGAHEYDLELTNGQIVTHYRRIDK